MSTGQSAELVLMDMQAKMVAQAVREVFERRPFVHAAWEAMTPEDRSITAEKIRADATEKGFMRMDAPTWLEYHVDEMYDAGKLPEVEKAAAAVIARAQAIEDHAILNGKMEDVRRYLTTAYRDPAQAELRRQAGSTSATDDLIHPG